MGPLEISTEEFGQEEDDEEATLRSPMPADHDANVDWEEFGVEEPKPRRLLCSSLSCMSCTLLRAAASLLAPAPLLA